MLVRCLLFTFLATSLVTSLIAAPVEMVPPDLRGAIQPQVAVAADGRVHVVFGKDKAVYHTSSADGREFSVPVKIGELDKLALGKRRGPRLAVSNGQLLATAISHADGNLHTWTSADNGATWQAGAALNTTNGSAAEGLQAVAGDGRGRVVAVWLDSRNHNSEVWGRESRDGGKTWQQDERIYAAPTGPICPCCVPNVAISPTGTVAVMWRNALEGSRDLYLATRQGNTPFSPATKVGTGTWKLEACPMDGGNLTFAPGGNWLAVWRREHAVFVSSPNVAEKQLSADASQPVAAYAGATPVLLWEAGNGLILQRGADAPAQFARGGKAASAASGKDAACVVWEGTSAAGKTLLFEWIR